MLLQKIRPHLSTIVSPKPEIFSQQYAQITLIIENNPNSSWPISTDFLFPTI